MTSDTPMTTTAGTADMMATVTTVQLAIIVIFALVVIVGIVWGIRAKRKRVAAEAQTVEDREALEAAAPPPPIQAEIDPVPTETETSDPTHDAATSAPLPIPGPGPGAEIASSEADDITRLKGLGPKLQARLAELGITRLDQIATMDDAQVASLDAQLGAFQGRITRDRWVEQARLLTSGDIAGYEAQFGKLGG